MIPGETILTGALKTCPDCGVTPDFEVLLSGAGYYIGTFCLCGPYSRESGYFGTRKEAEAELEEWERGECISARTTDFQRDGNLSVIAVENIDDPEELLREYGGISD